MRLLTSEMLRLVSRRLFRVMGVGAVVVILVSASIVFFKSHKSTDAGVRAEAERLANEAMAECLAHPERFGGLFEPGVDPDGPRKVPVQNLTPEQARELCETVAPPVDALVRDPRYHMVNTREATQGLSALVIFLAVLMGASFMGAEWHPRTMTTMLTWEPRRVRLWFTKALAVGLVVFAVSVVLQALLVGSLAPAALFRGTTQGADGAWLGGLVRLVLRTSLVSSLAAVFAMAIATLGRTTVAALGIGFVYFAIIERILSGLRPGWRPWLVGENAGAVIGWSEIKIPPRGFSEQFGSGGMFGVSEIVARTPLAAVWVLLAYVAAVAWLAAWALRRQDVG